ncbi:hypothetical protein GUITHDRAFT_139932 [Guillardia theta CCMP2712]|uniref:Uncharacterized protein n=1 Tax=Guillardia theta (strain CCMP2712) TaxID=905079 RepID=L1J6A6_GUITC|nr:hypothetical protein GUITHDRAFT_139932 [Guillardia theta CCMP2712]EKX44073.1 hypothetical protein GUITHDRAFT_139932 [Guillardia theta CCMP2712]|eukprot:XP_005831053.1 hypothetical protein GUITHDRAFT_139932 [Guillardia theta CCMP2712]
MYGSSGMFFGIKLRCRKVTLPVYGGTESMGCFHHYAESPFVGNVSSRVDGRLAWPPQKLECSFLSGRTSGCWAGAWPSRIREETHKCLKGGEIEVVRGSGAQSYDGRALSTGCERS